MRRFMVALMVVLTICSMVGCGGGGRSANVATTPTVPQEPTACVDTQWEPQLSTISVGVYVDQTSNCGSVRTHMEGTKNFWQDRNGVSAAILFKNYTGQLWKVVAASNTKGGALVFGVDSNAKNNKGVLVDLDNTSSELWRAQVDSPIGNTLVPKDVVTNGAIIFPGFERLPLRDFVNVGFNADGSFQSGEHNSGYGLEKVNMVFDAWNSSKLLISRIQPSVPLPAPIPFSPTQIEYKDMLTSGLDIAVTPPIPPKYVTFDSTGINVVSSASFMKYARDLTVLASPTLWSAEADAAVHDVKTIGDRTFIAGTIGGNVKITEVGNAAFRNTLVIPVGDAKIKLCPDESGNLFAYVGNRVGRVDLTTGEINKINPVAVPSNAECFVSGQQMYFVVNGNALYRLAISQIPQIPQMP